MKKLIYGSLFFAIVGIGIVGCKKEDIQSSPSQLSAQIIDDNADLLSDISYSYVQTQQLLTTEKLSPRWNRIIGADLTGALGGAIAGGAAGSLIGGVGAGPGALIGGLLGGAGASFTEAGGIVAPGNQGGTPIIENINNPYDFVGILHYEIMGEMTSNHETYWVNNELNYSLYKEMVFSKLKSYSIDNFNNFNDDFWIKEIKFHAAWQEEYIEYFSSSNSRLSTLSNTCLSIAEDYYSALTLTNNTDDFVQYSINAENLVVNSNLIDIEKKYLLIFMSTARIGVGYYN